jgi:hypothetical protein
VGQQRGDVSRAGVPVHRHQSKQHQHRARQRVEEELEASIDPPLTSPHTDDQEHRDEPRLEEEVKQHQIQGAKDADHQGFQHQEGDHVLLDALINRGPACQNAQRHQERRQDDEQHGDAVNAQFVFDRSAKPIRLLEELEIGAAGVEVHPDVERGAEGE